MKRLVTICVLILLLLLTIPYLFVEIETAKYGKEFATIYKDNTTIKDVEYCKVYYCIGEKAKVYYVEKGKRQGHFVNYKKYGNKWELDTWEVIWSKDTGKDGIFYPFYR